MQRSYNWDLLRSISMFLVVVAHSAKFLGAINGIETVDVIRTAAVVCDSIFFALSGYFAIAPQKRSLVDNYLNKVVTIIIPLLVYAVPLYLAATRVVNGSIPGFIAYLLNLLKAEWWFIPTLIPCLVAAPFISKGFESLSDRDVRRLCVVLCALYAMGAVCLFGKWGFDAIGMPTLANLSALPTSLVPAGILLKGPAYFQLFIFGGIYRRLASSIRRTAANRLIVIGIACWIADVALMLIGATRSDPSYFWLFTTFAVFALFERISISGALLQKCIAWTAKRSYTVYLLQGAVIPFIGKYVYDQSVFGNIAGMHGAVRIILWVAFVVVSYLVSLAFASLLDVIMLKPIQNGARKLISRLHERGNEKPVGESL